MKDPLVAANAEIELLNADLASKGYRILNPSEVHIFHVAFIKGVKFVVKESARQKELQTDASIS